MPFLSNLDIRSLFRDPSPESREKTAVQVTEIFKSRAMEGKAAEVVDEIIRIFAHDAAIRVRAAVAEQLKHDPDLPPDVARTLANDVDDVAIPILKFSRALSDEDLAEIVVKNGAAKQSAIAARLEVSAYVSDLLIEHGDADVVATLFANSGSAPSEEGMLRAVDRFGDDDRVQTPLARRRALPQTVLARMVAVVSEHVLHELAAREDIPADLAQDIVAQAEERAYLKLSMEHQNPAELAERLRHLGRLTPNLAMRAVVCGDMRFFEEAAMRLTGIPRNGVCTLAYDAGALGARELSRRMGAKEHVSSIIEVALGTYSSLMAEDITVDVERFQSRMLERILSRIDDFGPDVDTFDIDVIVNRMRMRD